MTRYPWITRRAREKAPTWGSAEALAEALAGLNVGPVKVREPMAEHTTLRVGGPADVYVEIRDEQALLALLATARRLGAPVTVVGNGSNLLVRDGGLPGVAVSLKALDHFQVLDEGRGLVDVGAGLPMNRFIREGLERGFEGVWFLTGIPGTLGGALRMNAGTRYGEIAQVVKSVRWLSPGGRRAEASREALSFEYRSLSLPQGSLVLGAELELGVAADRAELKKRHREVLDYRLATQPLQLPSCGSVFRNPAKDAAGRLIEECGLKGVRIRGAQVSTQHANWIVNVGEATAGDVLLLMKLVHEKVLEMRGIPLVPEVHVVGRDE